MTATDATPPRPLGAAWRRMSTGRRVAVVVAGSVLVLNMALAALDSVVGGNPGGPMSSSYTTDDDGFGAWADLLAGRGHDVRRLQTPFARSTLDPRSTVVLADPDRVSPADLRRAARFVGSGGRLVLAGRSGTPMLAALSGERVRWSYEGLRSGRALLPVPETTGVRTVAGSGNGRYDDVGSLLPVVGADGRFLAVVAAVGRGTVIGLADVGVLHNRRLADADNAAFALAVVGPRDRPVVFAEAEHGFGEVIGLGAVPAAWKWAGVGLLAAVLTAMWAYGQRFGPVEDEHRRLRPARRDYVDALAADLGRVTRWPVDAARPLAIDARRRLTDRLALPVDADDAAVRAAAERSGMPAADVEPLLQAPVTEADLVAVGRAAARLRTDGRTDSTSSIVAAAGHGGLG